MIPPCAVVRQNLRTCLVETYDHFRDDSGLFDASEKQSEQLDDPDNNDCAVVRGRIEIAS
jgi:hypothetical protein